MSKLILTVWNIFSYISPEKALHFMQVVSLGDNFHEMLKDIFLSAKAYFPGTIKKILQTDVYWFFYPAR